MQCTARADAVHCGSGCSALRGRLQCTASEMGKTGTEIVSPILDKRKGRRDTPHMGHSSPPDLSTEPAKCLYTSIMIVETLVLSDSVLYPPLPHNATWGNMQILTTKNEPNVDWDFKIPEIPINRWMCLQEGPAKSRAFFKMIDKSNCPIIDGLKFISSWNIYLWS